MSVISSDHQLCYQVEKEPKKVNLYASSIFEISKIQEMMAMKRVSKQGCYAKGSDKYIHEILD